MFQFEKREAPYYILFFVPKLPQQYPVFLPFRFSTHIHHPRLLKHYPLLPLSSQLAHIVF